MKLKLKEIWMGQQAMPKLLNRELADGKAAYWIGRNAKKLESIIVDMEKERVDLVKKYGHEDKDSRKWSVPPDKKEEFDKVYSDMMEKEVEVDIKEVSIESLKDAKLSPIDLASIDFMIKE